LMAQYEVPLIGPLTLYPQTGSPLNRQVFYLLSGIDLQVRALVRFAAKKSELSKSGVAILYPKGDTNAGILEAVKDESKREGLDPPLALDHVAGGFGVAETVKGLRQSGRQSVFFIGSSAETLSLMKEAEKINWFPSIYVVSATIGPEIFNAPSGFDGRLFVPFPASPADQSPEAIARFRNLSLKYKLPEHHIAAQVSAYSAAGLLVEGLKRAGKDLSREKLIQALEGLYNFPTGTTPPISYGPNRRVGASGAYVVTIDLKEKRFVPASGWINVD
jgi:ABC-type branched-subunit amino acid transport system substrate-binding protein